MIEEKQFKELVKKIQEMKAKGEIDLSTEEDLSIAVMNLISLEEHFFFSGVKTKDDGYFDLLKEVRNMRKNLLGKLIDKNQHEGETWCVAKHLLATAMRLIEVGTKLNGDGKNAEAKEIFKQAHKMYSLFWGLRLKLIDVSKLKEMAKGEKKPWTLEDIMDKLVDCCDE